jgi:hypothetical protein
MTCLLGCEVGIVVETQLAVVDPMSFEDMLKLFAPFSGISGSLLSFCLTHFCPLTNDSRIFGNVRLVNLLCASAAGTEADFRRAVITLARRQSLTPHSIDWQPPNDPLAILP